MLGEERIIKRHRNEWGAVHFFAVPFTACWEREIQVLRPLVRYIRLSQESDSFALPRDAYHIPIHALFNQPDVQERIEAFARLPAADGLFVLAGHSYELEAYDLWGYMEELLRFIQGYGFEHLTTMEFVERYLG